MLLFSGGRELCPQGSPGVAVEMGCGLGPGWEHRDSCRPHPRKAPPRFPSREERPPDFGAVGWFWRRDPPPGPMGVRRQAGGPPLAQPLGSASAAGPGDIHLSPGQLSRPLAEPHYKGFPERSEVSRAAPPLPYGANADHIRCGRADGGVVAVELCTRTRWGTNPPPGPRDTHSSQLTKQDACLTRSWEQRAKAMATGLARWQRLPVHMVGELGHGGAVWSSQAGARWVPQAELRTDRPLLGRSRLARRRACESLCSQDKTQGKKRRPDKLGAKPAVNELNMHVGGQRG